MSELREKNFVEKKRYEIRNGKFGTYFYDTEEEKDMTLKEIQKFLNLFWINFENSNKNEIASHEHGLKLENKITQLEKEIEDLKHDNEVYISNNEFHKKLNLELEWNNIYKNRLIKYGIPPKKRAEK